MTKEDKELLLAEFSARLPYGVVYHRNDGANIVLKEIDAEKGNLNYTDNIEERECIPYLRPMTSMTDKELKEYTYLCDNPKIGDLERLHSDVLDWVLKNHFDFRLLPKGLAITVTDKNNPYAPLIEIEKMKHSLR